MTGSPTFSWAAWRSNTSALTHTCLRVLMLKGPRRAPHTGPRALSARRHNRCWGHRCAPSPAPDGCAWGRYLIRRHLRGLELALGGAQQQRVGGVEGEQVLVLGVDQIRGVELVDEAPCSPAALALGWRGCGSARHAGVDCLQLVLVITDVAHRLDLLVDGNLLTLASRTPGSAGSRG